MLKGSMEAVVIYRRGWRKSSDGGVAKTPFCNWGKTISRNSGPDVHSEAHTTLCWDLCLLSTVVALLLNGSFSLFGPGNSVAKWLLLETSTRKLWMAAAALLIVTNATVFGRCWCDAIYWDCHSSFDADLLYWFKDSNVFRNEKYSEHITRILSVFCFVLYHAKLTADGKKGPLLLIWNGILSAAHFLNGRIKISLYGQFPSVVHFSPLPNTEIRLP